MATASTSSISRSPEEKTNGFKLMRLIIGLGTEALRNEFKKIHPAGNLHTVFSSHQSTLNRLKVRNVITHPQWDKLYPPVPKIPNIKEFDITLLVILLRNICGIPAPIGTGWNKMPVNSDTSLGANIVRVKLFRNEFFGHIPETDVSTTEFEARWKEVSTTLVHLSISQTEIDRLKDEECGEEEIDRIRREWSENDTRVALQLLGLKKMRTEDRKLLLDIQSDVKSIKSEKSSFNDLSLSKYLVRCNFDANITLINQKWCKGTREWVFDEVSRWFNDTMSDSRAFIITGQAGMGKSVIAAVICERFAEKLAACHFCQYNNDRYDNPKILLQSLAAQLSNVIPEYRKALIEKLSGKEGERLDDKNIQALFSLLFTEPLTGIKVAEKHLIVIDAVDESEHKGRSDLVDLIANYLCQLPSFIRFLITSRPENAIEKKLKKLKPMVLSRNDEQNVKDIRVFFEEKLSGLEQAKYIGKLVKRSDGLMLVANFLYQFLKDSCSSKFDIDDLPTGIEEIYESHFRRLKKELEMLKVSEGNFLLFLSVVAVAWEPLPIALVETLFRSGDDPPAISRSKINKIKNCLSVLLVINEDRITFLHKSVKDWLVESDHEFTVDVKLGHGTLANICAKELDEVKRNGTKPPFYPASQYALLYGIQHKMAGTQDKPLKSFIDKYVTDLEIMYACVIMDVYALFNNIVSLKNNTIYGSLPENTRDSVETLRLLIRKYIGTLKDFPQSFFQCVLNSGEKELSSKAASLLKARYKEQVYFELARRNNLEASLVGRIYLSGPIRGFDISPSEDYLICGYEDGKLELFSLVDFKSLWTIQADFRREVPLSDVEPARPIVFHPKKNVILPATLDCVVNLHGRHEPGPFLCEDIDPRFDNCCFSSDQSKMATTCKNILIVWSLTNNEKLRSFSSNNALTSVMFSADGRFLATSDLRHAFVVYNVAKDFISISKTLNQCKFFVSPLKEDSWIVGSEDGTFTLNSDLCQVDFYPRYLAYPNCCFPLNGKAVAEFEDAMKNREKSWLSRFGYNKFFCLDNGIAVVWEHSTKLKLFRISRLKKVPLKTKDPLVVDAQHIDISVDGKFLYAQQTKSLSIHEVNYHSIPSGSSRRWSGIPFRPVPNGVFFCGNLDDSRDWFHLDEAGNRRYLSDIPELWNCDLTERLDSFPELSGTKDCLPVSGEIVACVMDGKVLFFNVAKREAISETHVRQNTAVIACSSNYHVLMRDNISSGTPPSLWRAGEVAELKDASNEPELLDRLSGFSPSGKTLVLHFQHTHHFYIFDVSPAILRFKIDLEFFGDSGFQKMLRFLDEDHFLCPAYYTYICVINVTSGNALAFIECGGMLGSCCVSRTPDNSSVLLHVKTYNKTKLFKVWCHLKRK